VLEGGDAFEEAVEAVQGVLGEGGGDEEAEEIDGDGCDDQAEERDAVAVDAGGEGLGVEVDVVDDGDGGGDGDRGEDAGEERGADVGGEGHLGGWEIRMSKSEILRGVKLEGVLRRAAVGG